MANPNRARNQPHKHVQRKKFPLKHGRRCHGSVPIVSPALLVVGWSGHDFGGLTAPLERPPPSQNNIVSLFKSTSSRRSSSSSSSLASSMAPRNTSPHRLVDMDPEDNDLVHENLDEEDMKPLMESHSGTDAVRHRRASPGRGGSLTTDQNEFWQSAKKFSFCFCGLMVSYLTWGYMQELIMSSKFIPTDRVPDGKFPSAAFCVFSNRLLAVIVAMVVVRLRHGAVFANNTAPLWAFSPAALSNTLSSWSQYAALKYVTFPEQTVFKSSKIIAVMLMGKALQGKAYPWSQYMEALVITVGVFLFSYASKAGVEDRDNHTEAIGLLMLVMYVAFDSFTSQYQDKVYQKYGKDRVDPFQMMLGVNVSAICMTTFGLIVSGDLGIVWEFLLVNPSCIWYNILTAITSATGQIFIFYTIQQFGPIVFTVIMTTRQMLSICLSTIAFGHTLSPMALFGGAIVFGVLFNEVRRKYQASKAKNSKATLDAAPQQVGSKGIEVTEK